MVAHGHKAVEGAGGIQSHANHDQQTGTAQLNAQTGEVAQNDRQYSHRSQEDGTHEGDLIQGAVAVLPIILGNLTGMSIQLGGTSLLIVVGVALDTTRSLDSFMTMRNHKGFLG